MPPNVYNSADVSFDDANAKPLARYPKLDPFIDGCSAGNDFHVPFPL
jgi:hypothetical protein